MSSLSIDSAEFAFAQRFIRDLSVLDGGATPYWGDSEVLLYLPGGPCHVSGLAPEQAEAIGAAFDGYCGEPGDEPGRVQTVRVGRLPEGVFPAEPFVMETLRLETKVLDGLLLMAGPNFLARVAWGEVSEGALLMHHLAAPSSVLNALLNYLRPMAALELATHGSLLLHSGAVLVPGEQGPEAFVFFGPSGAGKSTISRLSLDAGYDVLSDDLNVLTPVEDGVLVEHFPQAGELRDRQAPLGRYPLRGLCRLSQGNEPSLEVAGRASSAALLVSSSPYVNDVLALRDPLFDLAGAITELVPVQRLTFRKDPGFWDLLLGREI